MKSITCIIIDDENPARSLIKAFLQKTDNINILAEVNNGFDAVKEIDKLKPDFIFLDIQMPKLNGFEVLELIHHKPKVIFTTAYDEFALKAFEENAVDYLLKPFSFDRFSKSLERIQNIEITNTNKHDSKIPNPNIKRIVVKEGATIQVIQFDEITHIQSNDDYVIIKTIKGEFVKNQTMNHYEKTLPKDIFIRIHRSSIINITGIKKLIHISKENYEIELSNKERVKVSKSNIKKVKDLIS